MEVSSSWEDCGMMYGLIPCLSLSLSCVIYIIYYFTCIMCIYIYMYCTPYYIYIHVYGPGSKDATKKALHC